MAGKWHWVVLIGALSGCSSSPPSLPDVGQGTDLGWVALNQIDGGTACEIRITQGGRTIAPAVTGSELRYRLASESFSLYVRPINCHPRMASIRHRAQEARIFQRPLVYGTIGFQMAVDPKKDMGRLVFWAREDIYPDADKPPSPDTFEGRQFIEVCKRLGYCPNTYPDFSTSGNFSETFDRGSWVAHYSELTSGKSLTKAKGAEVLNVMYTNWQGLPNQYPMADPIIYLRQPHRIRFIFP
jgi:hypothetical protein